MQRRVTASKFKKRGNAVVETGLVVVLLLVFIVSIYYSNWLFDDLNDDIQADDDISDTAKQMVNEHNGRFSSIFDGLFVFVFVMLWIMVLVASVKIDTHPIFFGVSFLLLVAMFWVSAEVGNTYEDTTSDADISGIADEYSSADFIMTHLLEAAIVIGFTIMIVLFAKSRGAFG